ncbi:hypothetical protein [Ferruginibacter sp.]|uniref:hypothetical protein n=1 Tax=Ferruginibacter sp. TaxID=1940288 RepID=UPI00374D23DE
MIPNFEEYTHDLTEYELSLVPKFSNSFKNKIGKQNAVTSKVIEEKMIDAGHKVSGPRIRKIVNYIRNIGIVEGLIGSNYGYYITTDKKEIEDYIESLESRETAIKVVREGMEAYLRRLKIKENETKG